MGRPFKGKEKINKTKAVELIKSGVTMTDVAKLMSCSVPSISLAVKGMLLPDADLEEYKAKRADIFASKQAQAIENLTAVKLKAASAYQLAGIAGLLQDKEMAIRGLPGQIIAYYDINMGYQQLMKARQETIAKLGYDPAMTVSPDLPDKDDDPTS